MIRNANAAPAAPVAWATAQDARRSAVSGDLEAAHGALGHLGGIAEVKPRGFDTSGAGFHENAGSGLDNI
jgi:hypothetical protein